MKLNCKTCTEEFKVWPSAFKYGNPTFCSRKCMGKFKKGKPSYVRTEEHKQKMSDKIKSMDLTRQSKLFSELNGRKKGKTLEEIYGEEKAALLRGQYGRRGTLNGRWVDGRSSKGYLNFGRALRRRVKERDGYRCLWCGITDEKERDRDALGRGLAVHHIDHNRENGKESNLATLCKSCNSLEVKRQTEWQPKLQEVVNAYN